MLQKIRIKLKSYDHAMLDQSAAEIVRTARRTGRRDVGPGAAADAEDRLHGASLAARGQEVARAVRDPHPQAADRHHALDRADDGGAREAGHPGRRRHRDQDLNAKAGAPVAERPGRRSPDRRARLRDG